MLSALVCRSSCSACSASANRFSRPSLCSSACASACFSSRTCKRCFVSRCSRSSRSSSSLTCASMAPTEAAAAAGRRFFWRAGGAASSLPTADSVMDSACSISWISPCRLTMRSLSGVGRLERERRRPLCSVNLRCSICPFTRRASTISVSSSPPTELISFSMDASVGGGPRFVALAGVSRPLGGGGAEGMAAASGICPLLNVRIFVSMG
mmetsp:Transcript_32619/g.81783  ORF Transcript_32619/g.81783 Transcript_32619/m.81783 type:complete len:210 (-) Transcript_32619:664-1293(-)